MTRRIVTIKLREETRELLYKIVIYIREKRDKTYNFSDLVRDSIKYYLMSNLDMFPEELREEIKRHLLEPW